VVIYKQAMCINCELKVIIALSKFSWMPQDALRISSRVCAPNAQKKFVTNVVSLESSATNARVVDERLKNHRAFVEKGVAVRMSP
jgi:hypothetical protein